MLEAVKSDDGKAIDIRGILPVSMLDWPGKIACVIFLGGCNLSCPFCQNHILLKEKADNNGIDFLDIERYLLSKKNWLDGVVITGGEPSINPGLGKLISRLKAIGYRVKLDTNGTRPQVLSQLIKEGLIDYFALDIKTSFDKYDLLGSSKAEGESALETIDLIIASGLDHEFRTTVVPGVVSKEDIIAIASMLGKKGAKRYFLQQYNPNDILSGEFKTQKPFKADFLKELTKEANKLVPTELRGCS